MNRRPLAFPTTLACFCLALTGCQSGPFSNLIPDRQTATTFQAPTDRAKEARAIAAQATGADTPEQQALLADLARRIQSEQDPLVRESLIESIAVFPMPLAGQVLEAGLRDPEPGVRQRCCETLGRRGLPTSVPVLAKAAADDENFDVRVAATLALGEIKSPEAVRALAASLEDRNPALQYAGVKAMQTASGQDFGGDVAAYLAYAKGEAAPAPSVAANPVEAAEPAGFWQRLSPF